MNSIVFANIFFVAFCICYFAELIISISLSKRFIKNKRNPEAVKKPNGFRLWKAQVAVFFLCFVLFLLGIIFDGFLAGKEGIQRLLTVLEIVGLSKVISEQLKAANQTEWVGEMNRVREMVQGLYTHADCHGKSKLFRPFQVINLQQWQITQRLTKGKPKP